MTNSNPSSLAASTQEIKIYEKTYRLPVLNSPNFSRLQQQIKARQQIIKSDKRFIQREIESKGGFFGLGKRKEVIREAKPITFEEKFKELEILITDYNKIINFLTQHKDAYQDFFLQLTDELKSIVNQKCQELDRVEQRRLEGLAEAEDDPILLDLYRNQQQQIFRIAFVLYRATQLMLKKVDLINRSIQKLADDQVEQRQLLEKMVGRLGKYQKAYAVQQNINQLEQDVKRLADVAVNFESLMSDFLGPFQGLIDQVVSIDQELSGTVEEIRILAGDILTQDVRLFAFDESESISNSIIDFLVKSNTKQERIRTALDDVQFETMRSLDQLFLPPEVLENTSLTTALSAIQTQVDTQLTAIRSNYQIEEISLTVGVNDQEPNTVGAKVFRPQLKSEKGIDYTKLEELLRQQKWKEADKETYVCMITAVGKKKGGYFRKEDIENFPCEDLRTIDQLWVQYSKGRFGFSVQKNIWLEVGGKVDGETERKLGDRVGWRKGGEWMSYDSLQFNLSAPPGHLPVSRGAARRFWAGCGVGGVFSRAKTCNL